jgi:hypothetical protein
LGKKQREEPPTEVLKTLHRGKTLVEFSQLLLARQH